MINTYRITTGMGKCFDELPFLNKNEYEEFNSIGYSGKTLDGKRTSRIEFLNNLGKGEFAITQTKFDDGSFEERFTIVWVREPVESILNNISDDDNKMLCNFMDYLNREMYIDARFIKYDFVISEFAKSEFAKKDS